METKVKGVHLHDIPLVEKETISDLTFPDAEVISGDVLIKERLFALHRATALGNLEKHKVTIIFEDAAGLKRVQTTIWAMTGQKIVLKAGRSIPVHRIHAVEVI